MRVVHVLGELRASGAEVMLYSALPVFRELGVDTLVASTGARTGTFASKFERAGVPVLHLPFSKSGEFAMAFARELRAVHPQVIHLHTERANAAFALIAHNLRPHNVVRTVHSVFAYTGRLRWIRVVERAALRLLGTKHVSVSRSVERNELERLLNPTVRIDNWIHPRFRPPSQSERRAARAELGLDSGAHVITTVGNCSVVKNHRALIEALPEIASASGRTLVYLHVGSEDHGADERILADRALRHPAVEIRFLGNVEDVLPVLWATDVFCMPSLYEGLGIAALEAVACGCPVVLAAVPGLTDIHEPSPSVRYVAPNPAGLFEGVVGMFSQSPAELAMVAQEVSARIRAAHSMETQVKRLVSIYLGS